MKAQVIRAYGDANQFALDTVPTPQPQNGQVRVRVRTVGVNPMDVRIRSGSMKDQMPLEFPAILGSDFAGEVDATGGGVTDLSAGDRVVGLAPSGAYAEYVVVSRKVLAALPDSLGFDAAATLPTAAATARRVIDQLKPAHGETFVVNGGAGSVGSAAVQLLVAEGITVIATAGEDNHDYLQRLGAVPTTYGDGVADRIRALTPHGVDAVFDVADHGFVDAAISLRGGTDRVITISDFGAGQKGVTVSYGDSSKISADDFAPVVDLAAAGKFATEIARTFPFDRMSDAHRLSESGHLRGKIIVTVP